MQRCYKCGQTKPYTGFYRDKSRPSGYARKCISCEKLRKQSYYLANKEAHRRRDTKAQKRKKSFLEALKNITPCKDCSLLLPYWSMQFDHLKSKSFELGSSTYKLYSWEKIKAEIKKCDIVCANCHTHRTSLRRKPNASLRKRYVENKNFFDKLKKLQGCVDCLIRYEPHILQYDHIEKKNFTISTGYDRKSKTEILKEIKNCEVVCVVCHFNRTRCRLFNQEIKLLNINFEKIKNVSYVLGKIESKPDKRAGASC